LRERVAESDDPRKLGKALQGTLKGSWAYRVGDHRILCTILDSKVTVVVIEIGDRRELYR
jgi:mRNA interferase RelE/StbE